MPIETAGWKQRPILYARETLFDVPFSLAHRWWWWWRWTPVYFDSGQFNWMWEMFDIVFSFLLFFFILVFHSNAQLNSHLLSWVISNVLFWWFYFISLFFIPLAFFNDHHVVWKSILSLDCTLIFPSRLNRSILLLWKHLELFCLFIHIHAKHMFFFVVFSLF